MIRRPPRSTLFPSRRSSDLPCAGCCVPRSIRGIGTNPSQRLRRLPLRQLRRARSDRKSTRLNSSHVEISYAVFCLKKKTKKNKIITLNRQNYHQSTTLQ